MATAALVHWKHKKNSAGHSPIWLRFTDTRRALYLSTGVSVHPRYWNETKREVRKNHPHAVEINTLLRKRLDEVEGARLHLLAARKPITAKALKLAVTPQEQSTGECLIAYARAKLAEAERRGKVGRFRRGQTVMNKLEAFAGRLPFANLTPAFLEKYENHLIATLGNKESTVQANIGEIRAHVRQAIREGVIPRELDPFTVYRPPKAKSPKRHKLTDGEIDALETLDLGGSGPAAPQIARVRDAFLFSLYNAGMRFGDVAQLLCSNLRPETRPPRKKGGKPEHTYRLRYTMEKTGRHINLLLHPRAYVIAAAYMVDEEGKPKPPDALLFGMLDGYDTSTPKGLYNAIAGQNTRHNNLLREIAERAGIVAPFSFHISKHSFADLARRRGWGIYELSKALGHGTLGTTETYMAEDDVALVDSSLRDLFSEVPK